MEAIGFLRMTAVAAAFAAAAFALPVAVSGIRRARVAKRLETTAMMGGGGLLGRVLRNGIEPATGIARSLRRNGRVAGYFEDVRWFACHWGYVTDADRAGGVVIVAALTVLISGWLVGFSPVFGAAAASCLVAALGIAARQAREREAEQMREALPDMLHALSACFHAGYSLLQSFKHLSRELQGPMAGLFSRAASDLETGRSAVDALQRMRNESSLSELAFVTAALEIQHQTGGSLQKVIDSACESIEGELALRRTLRVQTAQARLSMRVVTVMPFVLIAIFSLISPGFLAPFFSSWLGLTVLCIAMGMQLAGVLAVRRLLDVKES